MIFAAVATKDARTVRIALALAWGDYRGKAMIDVTRQLIFGEGAMYQLSASVESLPLSDLKGGNRWCGTPDELPALLAFVEVSEAFRLLADTRGAKVTYDLQ